MSNSNFTILKKIVIPCIILAGLAACKDGKFVPIPPGEGLNPFGGGGGFGDFGNGAAIVSGSDIYNYNGECSQLVSESQDPNNPSPYFTAGLPAFVAGAKPCTFMYSVFDSPNCSGDSEGDITTIVLPFNIFILPFGGSGFGSVKMTITCE